jgi:hypothetical protein
LYLLHGDKKRFFIIMMIPEQDDKIVKIIQSSTRRLLTSFRNKTQLRECSNDVKLLIREGYDINMARKAARNLFGKYDVPFLAIGIYSKKDL